MARLRWSNSRLRHHPLARQPFGTSGEDAGGIAIGSGRLSDQTNSRRRNYLTLLIASIASLGAAEVFLQFFGYGHFFVNPEREIFWQPDRALGWRHKPGQTGAFETPDFTTMVEINANGLRDSDHPYSRISGKQRVLALGDSMVWGFGVEQHEGLTERLEALLIDTEVINAGHSGYSTDQESLWLETEGVRYRPDLVVLLLTGNDDYGNHRDIIYEVYGKPRFRLGEKSGELAGPDPAPDVPVATRFLYWLRVRSAIAFQVWLANRGPEPVHEGFELTLRLLERIADTARSNDARFLIVSTSAFWLTEGATYPQLVSAIRDRGLPILEIDAEFGQPMGDGHWTAHGHAIAARVIAKAIEERRLLN